MRFSDTRLLTRFVLSALAVLPLVAGDDADRITHFLEKRSSAPTCTLNTATQHLSAYHNMGCYHDGSKRALTGAYYKQNQMSFKTCVGLCKNSPIVGVEVGQECFCKYIPLRCIPSLSYSHPRIPGGNQFENGEGYAIPLEHCTAYVDDNAAGGKNALSVYMPSITAQPYEAKDRGPNALQPATCQPPSGWQMDGWTNVGCAQDGPARALTGYAFTDEQMTKKKCIDTCSSKGYTIAGVEVARECYCESFRS